MNYTFKSFAKIKGIGAASGLFYEDDSLILISDDSDVLYRYHIKDQTLSKSSLRADGQLLENRPKPEKSDFESMTIMENEILIFGSGSSIQRNVLVIVKKNDWSQLEVKSLDVFYEKLKEVAQISDDNFNIEGVIAKEDELLLFNRGNGPAHQNGVFKIQQWESDAPLITFHSVDLSIIEGVPLGFTDAIQLEDKIYFIAAAESGGSTYHDGDVLGSLFGVIDANTFDIEYQEMITKEHKLEGIAFFKASEQEVSFLLCEDADDGGDETEVFEFVLIK